MSKNISEKTKELVQLLVIAIISYCIGIILTLFVKIDWFAEGKYPIFTNIIIIGSYIGTIIYFCKEGLFIPILQTLLHGAGIVLSFATLGLAIPFPFNLMAMIFIAVIGIGYLLC